MKPSRTHFDGVRLTFRLRYVFCVLVFLSLIDRSTCADVLRDFRAEYAHAAKRLERVYSHVSITATDRRTDRDGHFLWADRSEYLRDGEHVRVLQTIIASAVPNTQVGFQRVFGGTASKFFDVHRDGNRAAYVFQRFGRKSEEDWDSEVRLQCRPAFAPYCADAVRLDQYLESPAVHFVAGTMRRIDNVTVVDVLIEQRAPNMPTTRMHLYFLPGSYAFAGWTKPDLFGGQPMTSPHTNSELRIAYVGSNPPRVSSIERWTYTPNHQNLKIDQQIFEIESIAFGPVGNDKFELADLGIEAPGTVGKTTNLWWFILVSGITCAILGVLFGLLAHRRKVKSISYSTDLVKGGNA